MEIEVLRSGYSPIQYFENLYGVTVSKPPISNRVSKWSPSFANIPFKNDAGNFNRFLFESFCQFQKIVPKKMAAASLGMNLSSFNRVQEKILGDGLYISELGDLSEDFVKEEFSSNFQRFFPSIKHTLFAGLSVMCSWVHATIKETYNLEVEPIFCSAEIPNTEEPLYAYSFDYLTFEPVGLPNQIWLNNGKPINLRPDFCSVKTFFENAEILEKYLFSGQKEKLETERCQKIKSYWLEG